MNDTRQLFERVGDHYRLGPDAFERMRRRHERKKRNQRIATATVAIGVFVAVIASVFVFGGNPFDRSQRRPAISPPVDGALRHDGAVLVSYEGDVLAQDPVTGDTHVVFSVSDLGRGDRDGVTTETAAWSADGDWVAVELISCLGGIFCGHPDAGLWIQGADEPKVQLTRTCSREGCTRQDLWEWAPVGSRLALVEMDRRGGWKAVGPSTLSIIDPVGWSRVDVAFEREEITAIGWSPDGRHLAYAVAGDAPRVVVFDLPPETDPPVETGVAEVDSRVVTSEVGRVDSLSWSPDGSMLAIDGAGRLFVIGSDGSALHQLGEGTVSAVRLAPTWSPDGGRIAFRTAPQTTQARETGQIELEVWTTTPDGSDTVRVYAFGCCVDPSELAGPFWAPEGDRVAFTSDTLSYQGEESRPGTWRVVAADGSGEAETISPEMAKAWGGGRWPTGCTLVTGVC
jgi:hypothetical protein